MCSIPKFMMIQAAVLIKPGEIRLESRAALPPAPGEVEVAVSYVGICGTDLALFQGKRQIDQPVVPGHEFSGRVHALGGGVTGLQIGKRVSIAPLICCGTCEFCQSDSGYLCRERRIFGVQSDGALQERVNVPAKTVFPLSEGISLREGALIEPVAVAVHAVRQAGDLRNGRVAIFGAGAIGLLIAQVARARGAAEVILLDINNERLNLARTLGFTGLNNAGVYPSSWFETAGEFDYLFEASGASTVVEHFPRMLKPHGVIVIVGRFPLPVPLDLDAILLKEAKLVTSRYFSFLDYQDALQLLANQRVCVDSLIQGETLFDRLADGQGSEVMNAACQIVRMLIAFDTDR